MLPKSELSLELGGLHCEIDVSIVDRLTALLDPQPMIMNHPSNMQSRMFKSCTPLLVVWSYYCRSLLVEINASKFSLDRFVKDRVPSTLQRKI